MENHLVENYTMEDYMTEMMKEWRREVVDGIKELRAQQVVMMGQISKLREEFAKAHEHAELTKRVEKLEAERSKFIGAMLVLQAVGGGVVWIVSHLLK